MRLTFYSEALNMRIIKADLKRIFSLLASGKKDLLFYVSVVISFCVLRKIWLIILLGLALINLKLAIDIL